MLKPHERFYVAIIENEHNKKEKIIFKGDLIGVKDYSRDGTIQFLVKRELRKKQKDISRVKDIRMAYFLEIEELYIPKI